MYSILYQDLSTRYYRFSWLPYQVFDTFANKKRQKMTPSTSTPPFPIHNPLGMALFQVLSTPIGVTDCVF